MKYANGCMYVKGKQVSGFVCAKTYKRALELLKEIDLSFNMSHFNNYWSKCGNDLMKSLAKDSEGVWVTTGTQNRDYVKHDDLCVLGDQEKGQ